MFVWKRCLFQRFKLSKKPMNCWFICLKRKRKVETESKANKNPSTFNLHSPKKSQHNGCKKRSDPFLLKISSRRFFVVENGTIFLMFFFPGRSTHTTFPTSFLKSKVLLQHLQSQSVGRPGCWTNVRLTRGIFRIVVTRQGWRAQQSRIMNYS